MTEEFANAIASTKKGENIVVVSVFEKPVSLNMNMLFLGREPYRALSRI